MLAILAVVICAICVYDATKNDALGWAVFLGLIAIWLITDRLSEWIVKEIKDYLRKCGIKPPQSPGKS